jgi:uncharacterized protein
MINWRKWNRIIHRDFGYFFFFTTIIYAVSGIAINHRDDWNPNYRIEVDEYRFEQSFTKDELTKSKIKELLSQIDEELIYRSHYFSSADYLKVFVKDGNVGIDLTNGETLIEETKRRQILAPMNYLHYNPVKWWTIFSDIYSVGLFLIAISGLFILKGKNGITRRGAWLTGVGIIIPIVFLIIYFY